MPRYQLIAMLLILATASPTFGDEVSRVPQKTKTNAVAKAEEQPEWAALFGGASLPVVWQSANAAATNIAAAMDAKKFEGIADWAETVHLAAHALADQVRLSDGERQKRLGGALNQAAKIADQVLDAADHQDPGKLADSFPRMKAALKLAARRLPEEITTAPRQEVRSAKSVGQAHDGKRAPPQSSK